MLIKLAFGLVIGFVAAGAPAQSITDIPAKAGDSAYSQDGRSIVVRNPFGLCWRTGYWTPADAIAGCDGRLIPPIAKITAPAIPALPPHQPAHAATVNPLPKPCDFTVTLANEQSFEFNNAALSIAAKRRIDDEVMGKLAACRSIENFTITGHTDRIGTQQYNQKLSKKRARAVAAYLQNKGMARGIKTIGAGESQPIKACGDKRGRKQLIECLAPNRRVVIEVHGKSN